MSMPNSVKIYTKYVQNMLAVVYSTYVGGTLLLINGLARNTDIL